MFLLGMLPIVVVILGRFFERESERFEQGQGDREAVRRGDRAAVGGWLGDSGGGSGGC
jgi:hypothetical protein